MSCSLKKKINQLGQNMEAIKMNDLKWTKFSDASPDPEKDIFATNYEEIVIYSQCELIETDPHECYEAWAYVPIPDVPKEIKKRHKCQSPFIHDFFCSEDIYGNLYLSLEKKYGNFSIDEHFCVTYCPFCGYCSLEEKSPFKKNTCQNEPSKITNLVGKEDRKPKIGNIVIYWENAPAIGLYYNVAIIRSFFPNNVANLICFNCEGSKNKSLVPFSEEPKEGHWGWIE